MVVGFLKGGEYFLICEFINLYYLNFLVDNKGGFYLNEYFVFWIYA